MIEISKTASKTLPPHSWTEDKLAQQDKNAVQLIRERAAKLGVADLVDMCERDLARRSSQKTKKLPPSSKRSKSDTVIGYHLVCGRGRGVTEHQNGYFWSGSWVVAEDNARKSVERGAYLALHESKAEKSYRQGKVIDFRRRPRDMLPDTENGPPQNKEGIEFLVEESANPYDWVGRATGEKGYRWASDVEGVL